MKKVGLRFREKREELHLSLKEVENATSIRVNALQAIEDGHFDKFFSPTYALGFFKQYAVFLGFDGEQIIRENIEAFKISSQKQEFDYGIGTLEVRGSPGGGVKWMPNAIWVGAVFFVLLLAWYFAKLLGVF
ncbi:MAG: helix-turn-helix domain-containing protein [Chlamydiota bacterium]